MLAFCKHTRNLDIDGRMFFIFILILIEILDCR